MTATRVTRVIDFVFLNKAAGEFRRPRPLVRFLCVEVVGPLVLFARYFLPGGKRQ